MPTPPKFEHAFTCSVGINVGGYCTCGASAREQAYRDGFNAAVEKCMVSVANSHRWALQELAEELERLKLR